MTDDILYGKKCILFPMLPVDLAHFIELHRQDANGYMQKYCLKQMTEEEAIKYVTALLITNQIKVWTVETKQGKASMQGGFIYLTDMTSFSANISGIMDTAIMRGLLKHIRHGDKTFAEDAIRTLVSHCFNGMGLSRIETTVLSNNRRALALDRKCGFQEEGKFRDAFRMDDGYYDIIQLSVLKKDWKNEQG